MHAVDEKALEEGQLPLAHRYKLPTELQWLHALHGGSKRRPEDLEPIAWFGAAERKLPYLVAQKAANPWGLFDMVGNVWEWCGGMTNLADCASVVEEGAQVVQPPRRGTVIARGGSFRTAAEAMHWNIRKAVRPTVQDIDLGFRVVLVKARYRPMKVVAGEMVG